MRGSFADDALVAGRFVPARLPASFGTRYLVTVDTEEEFDWSAPFQRSGHTTISVPKLERFQQFVGKYGVRPTYFIDHSIVEDAEAVRFLRQAYGDGTADIGVHLHPWINPPFDEAPSDYNSFAGNLSPEIEERKIVHLRDSIEKTIGCRSRVYRAGRYGIGPNTAEILRRNGFVADSSVRAHFDYRDEGGPDFRRYGPTPFWLEPDALLEVPLTTVHAGLLRRHRAPMARLAEAASVAPPLLARAGLFERIPLTPEGVNLREAKEAIDIANDDGLRLLVFSFHSPSLSTGHTPYVRTNAELDAFYDWWRAIIAHCAGRGIKPTSIQDVVAAAGL